MGPTYLPLLVKKRNKRIVYVYVKILNYLKAYLKKSLFLFHTFLVTSVKKKKCNRKQINL